MGAAEIAVVAVLLVAYAAISRSAERWPVSMPMLFVAAGAITGVSGLVDVSADSGAVALLAEVTLAVILFSDAVRIDLGRLRRSLDVPIRLLAVGLPLTIVLCGVMNSVLFPEFSIAQVALLAAILAPTDAALGAAVVEDTVVPIRERLALIVESGVNDGLVVPVVAILTAVVLENGRSTVSWGGFVAAQVGGGLLLGVVIGGVAITVLRHSSRLGWSDPRYEQLATFAVPIVAVFAASAIGSNSFIAAFVAGLTFGSLGHRHDDVGIASESPVQDFSDETEDGRRTSLATRLGSFTEDAAQLLGVAAFFVFGNVLLVDAIEAISVPIVVCAVFTLTIGRMLPVWISLTRTGMRAPSRLFIGWFGPRGLASIVFGLLLLEDVERAGLPGTLADEVLAVVALTVTLSVVLHGATAAVGATIYGRWATANADAVAHMGASMSDVDLPRSRWSMRR